MNDFTRIIMPEGQAERNRPAYACEQRRENAAKACALLGFLTKANWHNRVKKGIILQNNHGKSFGTNRI